MAQVTLMTFLQQPLAAVPVYPPPQSGRNTTNQAYSYLDIQSLQTWQSFNHPNNPPTVPGCPERRGHCG